MPRVIPNYKKQAKETIMDSASQLFFEVGYHETRMDDIANKIGVTKGTLYLYFNSKEELLKETCNRNMALVEDSLNNLTSGNFIESVENFFKTELEMPDYMKFHWIFALGEMKSNQHVFKILTDSYKKYVKILSDKIEELKKKGTISKETDPQLLSKMLIAFHNGVLVSIMQGLDQKEAARLFKMGVEGIIVGIQ
jgi:AcrR family transcriptional regulator